MKRSSNTSNCTRRLKEGCPQRGGGRTTRRISSQTRLRKKRPRQRPAARKFKGPMPRPTRSSAEEYVAIVLNFPDQWGRTESPEGVRKRRGRAPDRALVQTAAITGHSVSKQGRVLVCATCGKRGVAKQATHWVRERCGESAVPEGISSAHRRGCLKHCGLKRGAWGAKRGRKLANTCRGWQSRLGKVALQMLARRFRPHGLCQWTEGAGARGPACGRGMCLEYVVVVVRRDSTSENVLRVRSGGRT